MKRLFLLFAIPLLLVTACGPDEVPLPTGSQRVSGVLERAPLSRIRRGTHLLRRGGELLYFVESAVVNLGTLEGKNVELEGLIEANTDPDALPVLVVHKVTRGGEEETREWSIPSVGVTLKVPRSWDAAFIANGAAFSASGVTAPMLRILRQTSDVLPFNFDTFQASSASALTLSSVVVDRKRAVTMLDASGGRFGLYVDLGPVQAGSTQKRVLSFLFPLDSTGDTEAQTERFEQIIASVRFAGASSSAQASSRPTTGTGSTGKAGIGKPCGGPAGVLCPQGLYCQVSDLETGVGTCQRL